jgi:CBS domain-containing protein
MKSVKVADHMTRRLITVALHTSVVAAMGLMLEHKISGMPVVTEAGALVGQISRRDVLKVAHASLMHTA